MKEKTIPKDQNDILLSKLHKTQSIFDKAMELHHKSEEELIAGDAINNKRIKVLERIQDV